MQNIKISSNHSSSLSSLASNHHKSTSKNHKSRLKVPAQSGYEYVGRIVTHERPMFRKSNLFYKNHIPSSHIIKKHRSIKPHYQEIYEDDLTSSDEDIEDLCRSLVYKLPTPPPQVKRVFHRLRSPEPKLIERIYVRRPTPEIIENIVEVPPEKVRIINRKKYLRQSKPITRTKLIHLRPHHHQQQIEEQPQSYIPFDQCLQQPTAFTYTLQQNPHPVSYYEPIIPPHSTFNPPILQSTSYTHQLPQIVPLDLPYGYSYY
ncbi:unnamed protein product [Rotaria sordida]|uniref:Uncharacterized protein n=1 Tax=Rotaria sordida TaxID=392033 RepID=A0A818Y392_9BILA|nr:unnamed protein product [Rotaria sordida]